MPAKIFQVDAFTNQPFSGNPAAVCLLGNPREDSWLLQVAEEMNLSETAFLIRVGNYYELRWFTPVVEVDLCGHATLASAHILWEIGELEKNQPACFRTRSGLLTARLQSSWIEMDFPAEPVDPCDPPDNLLEALNVSAVFVGKNRMDYFIEVETEKIVKNLDPDIRLLETVPARGIAITSLAASQEHDFVSRFFAPAAGIPEDPVTGSVHCGLGPYWAPRLGKTEMTARQLSRRGGIVRVGLKGDRVILGGQAVTIFQGELLA